MSIELKSSEVGVFPVAKLRAAEALGNRLLTEKNISGIIDQLIATNGFVIKCKDRMSNDGTEQYAGTDMDINLRGYRIIFNGINLNEIINALEITSDSSIYLSCEIYNEEIKGQDHRIESETSYYKEGVFYYEGVKLSTEPPAGEADQAYCLKILDIKKNGSSFSWSVPKESTQLFSLSSVVIEAIDGKR